MQRTVLTLNLLALAAALAVARPAAANDKLASLSRADHERAVADNADLPETWSRTENVEWVTDIPGLGWSSPVVWGQSGLPDHG